jgi:hypothetical protein
MTACTERSGWSERCSSERRARRHGLSALTLIACALAVQSARAQAPPASQAGLGAGGDEPGPLRTRATEEASGSGRRAATMPLSGLLSVSVGRGLRFNNPYRLERPLGDSAESVSLAATYLDLGLALLFGGREFRHGPSLGGAVALQGIGQFVLTPSYLAQLGWTDSAAVRGRVGVPIVVAPDGSLGLEAAVGSSLDVAYGFGALLELVGSVYFGAATDQTSITTIPMLSLQVGLYFEHRLSP